MVGGAAGTAGLSGLVSAKPGDKREVDVGFSTPAGERAARRAASDVNRTFALDAMTIEVPTQAIEGLRKNPNVRYVEGNGTMEALGQSTPWGIDRVDAEVAHASGEAGSGADVAIIDTGIDSHHPDLQASLGAGRAFVDRGTGGFTGNCAFYGDDNACNEPWDDDNGRDTHCAGTADADDDSQGVVGVSTDATLHAVKALDCGGSGSFSAIAAGQLMTDGLTASETRSKLKSTAEEIGLGENESGSGLLDAAAALGADSSDST